MSDAAPLPTQQHRYDELPELSPEILHARRELVFLILSGLFLGTLAMLNIIGITRFVDLSVPIPGTDRYIPGVVAVGVLPYPVTFLCTDFICELYGRRRANWLVMVGFMLNLWVVFILFVGGRLPGTDMPGGTFTELRGYAFGAVAASMIAYMVAQLIDVQLFHFWKRLTNGRHLWLRNNGSTVVSQLVDTIAVILITHYAAGGLPIAEGTTVAMALITYIASGYVFKLVVALLDTLPFYIGTRLLSRFLRLPPAGSS